MYNFFFFFFLQNRYETSSDEDEAGEKEGQIGGADGLIDLEDIGGMMGKMKSAKQRRLEEEEAIKSGKMEPREMVTPMLRKSLSKQGGYQWVSFQHLSRSIIC